MGVALTNADDGGDATVVTIAAREISITPNIRGNADSRMSGAVVSLFLIGLEEYIPIVCTTSMHREYGEDDLNGM